VNKERSVKLEEEYVDKDRQSRYSARKKTRNWIPEYLRCKNSHETI